MGGGKERKVGKRGKFYPRFSPSLTLIGMAFSLLRITTFVFYLNDASLASLTMVAQKVKDDDFQQDEILVNLNPGI